VLSLLGEREGPLFCEFYDVTREGNFEGRNILHNKELLENFAAKNELDLQELTSRFAQQRALLFKTREKRIPPLKDDKILTSWNGLMIFALAEAGSVFEHKEYLEAALKAANFIQKNLWKNGELLHRWRNGEALYSANLDDYAFLIRAYLSLFEADCGTEWLDEAIAMTNILNDQFKSEKGAYFQTNGEDPHLLLRKCQFGDGAEPSGNAIQCENLLRLYQLTGNKHYLQDAEDILKASTMHIENYPPGYCYHLINLQRYFDYKAPMIVVALNSKDQLQQELAKLVFHDFIPDKAVVWRHPNDHKLLTTLPFLKEQGPIGDKTTLYICHQQHCDNPLTDVSEMIEAIHKL
jgi:uncharacterized protein